MTTNPKPRPILTLPKPAPAGANSTLKYIRLREKTLGSWWPNAGSPPADWVIRHPKTGASEYCYLPEMKGPGLHLVEGPALLLFGEHWSRHNGYGYVHILKGHYRELGYKDVPELGHESLKKVADFVSKVLKSRTDILCEFSQMKHNHRPLVVNGIEGTVWLELRFENSGKGREPYYSVVTGIPKKKGVGTRIGNVK
jgi:hypothetical protein